MPRALNPNRAKLHRSYTVEEVANLFEVHKNTVRHWIKDGLPLCDERRPALILGADLRDYLQARRQARKRKCRPCEMYCLRCRSPQIPADNLAYYEPQTAVTGRLSGTCPSCNLGINKYTSLKQLPEIERNLTVQYATMQEHIVDRGKLLVNSDFEQET